MYHNRELLKYLVDTYLIDITKIYYVVPIKLYTILEKSEEVLKSTKERLIRKRKMTFFIDDLFFGEGNYDRIVEKTYQRLYDLENEVKERE